MAASVKPDRTSVASTPLPKSAGSRRHLGIEVDGPGDRWYGMWLRVTAWQYRRAISDWLLPVVCRSHRVLAEARSCWRRMKIESRRPLGLDPSLALGPISALGSAGHLQPCSRTHSCTLDIEALQADYPWATDFDLRVFLRGWRAGAEWGTAQPSVPSAGSYSEPQEHNRAKTA
jgi:hypothetical protein